jgi:hypothetical protein
VGEDGTFLVTNWHNLSGREPSTGQPKNANGAVPDKIAMSYHTGDEAGRVIQLGFNLYYPDGSPTWRQHSALGQRVDVAVVNITDLMQNAHLSNGVDIRPLYANDTTGARGMIHASADGQPPAASPPIKLKTSPGMDAFVLGYPMGARGTGILPIWKRGSIATDIDPGYNNLPCFLIDTATREGMSGSPVFLRSFGIAVQEDGKIGFGGPVFTQFLGIYSGRNIWTADEAQLGVVWKREVIDEIIAGGSPGNYELIS